MYRPPTRIVDMKRVTDLTPRELSVTRLEDLELKDFPKTRVFRTALRDRDRHDG